MKIYFLSTLLMVFTILIFGGNGTKTFAQPNTRNERGLSHIGVRDRRIAVPWNYLLGFPYSAIVKIKVTFPNGEEGWGTGAVVGPNKVLTAEHVVYDKETDQHLYSGQILPAYSSGMSYTFGMTYVSSLSHGTHDFCHRGADCDIAILNTTDAIGYKTGWFGMAAFNYSYPVNSYLAGYPEDLNSGESMYIVNTNARKENNSEYHNRLSYTDWTAGGMSGSPIFTSNYYIIGIHTKGGENANHGVALCNDLFTEIMKWRNQ